MLVSDIYVKNNVERYFDKEAYELTMDVQIMDIISWLVNEY